MATKELKKPNAHNAKLMATSNTAHKMYRAIDEIGLDAVDKIQLLLPFSENREEMYMEFPDNGAITMPHPFKDGVTVGVKKLFLSNKYELYMSWYKTRGDKELAERGVAILNHYGAVACVNLLNVLLIHYGQ